MESVRPFERLHHNPYVVERVVPRLDRDVPVRVVAVVLASQALVPVPVSRVDEVGLRVLLEPVVPLQIRFVVGSK